MRLPFVTTPAKINTDRGLINEQHVVRTVRGMTGCTVAGPYRFTQPLVFWIFLRHFLKCHCVRMTFPASLDQTTLHELRMSRSMRTMAIETPDIVN